MSRQRTRPTQTTAPPPVFHSAPAPVRPASGGQPLDPHTSAQMAARFGHDFSQVRIHTGSEAEEAAEAQGAQAFALGSDVVFGRGRWTPGSPQTERLLAHELTHVAQQAQWGQGDPMRVSRREDESEREAETLSVRALAGESVRVRARPQSALARVDDPAAQAHNAVMEQAAHVLSYENQDDKGHWVPKDPNDQAERQQHEFAVAAMTQAGYDVSNSRTVHGVDSFAMRTFEPRVDKDGRPVVAGANPIVGFRGTQDANDAWDDANPNGVGMGHFNENRDLIRQQMDAAYGNGQFGGVTTTGHSLGGALAQMAAVDAGERNPQEVSSVTTFQSARVSHDVAARMDAVNQTREGMGLGDIESRHNRAYGDIVPWAGADMTAGTIASYDRAGASDTLHNLATAHMSMPASAYAMQNGWGADLPHAAEIAGRAPHFQNPEMTTTAQDRDADWGAAEWGRRSLGLGAYNVSGAAHWGLDHYHEAAGGISGALTDAGARVNQAEAGVSGAAHDAVNWGGARGTELTGGVGGAAHDAVNWGAGRLNTAVDGVGGFLSHLDPMHPLDTLSAVGAAAPQALNFLGDTAGQAARGATGAVGDAARWTGRTAAGAAEGVGHAAVNAAHFAGDTATGALHSAGQAANWAGHTGLEAVEGVGHAALGLGQWAGESAAGAARSLPRVARTIGSGVVSAAEAGLGAASSAGRAIGNAAAGAGSAVVNAASSAGGAVVNAGSQAVDWLSHLW